MTKPDNQNLSSGLVISYFGASVAVEVDGGQVFQCHLRRNQELPVVGDEVNFQPEANHTGTIVSIVPRRSLLSRGDGQGKSKPIAANLDAMLIVMSPPPIFSEYLIDRYLIAAELLKIHPILVLNKTDLLNDETKDEAMHRLQTYEKIPYPVVLSSIYVKDGLADLKQQIKGKTAVLVGPSGVGKSSIIAALSDEAIQIGEVSMKGAGKHTTTATRLYHLPEGGQLIDSPGVREFNLWAVQPKEVLQGFKEFEGCLTGCKFRDCQHLAEPTCAVHAAVQDGKISRERYESYQKLMKEAASRKKYS